MNSVNSVQVQSTNDACVVSKSSAVKKNYFKDEFIEHFVDTKKRRASLIHLGYYTRAVILNQLITKFINFLHQQKILKFQIISCGAGFDTTYWRLSSEKLLTENSIFIEIDFPAVIQRKIDLINRSEKLKFRLKEMNSERISGINQMDINYFLLEADLSDTVLIDKLFGEIGIDYSIPTLFLSECVITYMKENDSNELIRWMTAKFSNSGFINYEQIHPDDGFGRVMLAHFNKLHSPLLSVEKYKDLRAHDARYKNLGFQNSRSVSEWDALIYLTSSEERRRVLSLELFDEFEEFHMKCIHYVVAVAGKGLLSMWIDSLPFFDANSQAAGNFKHLDVEQLECVIPLYRHSSCCIGERIYLSGGCDWLSRSSQIFRVEAGKSLNNFKVERVECLKEKSVDLDAVHGSLTHFEIDKTHYLCAFGGRKSPDKICNDGSAVIFELVDDKLHQKLVTIEGNPVPRYRTSLVSLNPDGFEVHCWMFGGRTADLNVALSDLWELTLKHDLNKNLIYRWKQHNRKNENWPCSRMSHSFTACPKKMAIFMVCGLKHDSVFPLNDIWKWCCRSESWQEVELKIKLAPRYGHTANLIGDQLYLVGGVSTLENHKPGVARIDLVDLTVTEYAMKSSPKPVLLFNHSSEAIGDESDAEILICGGGGNCFSFGTHLNQGILRLKDLPVVEPVASMLPTT